MDMLRRSALRLAGLADEDRAWILERLPEASRLRVADLLAELRKKGVAFDEQLLAELEPPRPEERRAGLGTASAREVLDALEGEPDWIVASLLRSGPWPWRGELLRLVPAERAARIEAASRALAAPAARAVEALLAAAEQRVTEALAWRR